MISAAAASIPPGVKQPRSTVAGLRGKRKLRWTWLRLERRDVIVACPTGQGWIAIVVYCCIQLLHLSTEYYSVDGLPAVFTANSATSGKRFGSSLKSELIGADAARRCWSSRQRSSRGVKSVQSFETWSVHVDSGVRSVTLSPTHPTYP